MQKTEVKRVKPDPKKKLPRDPSMKAGTRGGDKQSADQSPDNQEVPIIQRYSE
jgi:hypothetical protein